VCTGITKHHDLVPDVADVARVVKEAFIIAMTGRQGPVLIDVPKDIQQAKTVPDYDVAPDLPGFQLQNPRAKPEQIRQIAAAIKLAKRPIIYAGGGIISAGASEELRTLRSEEHTSELQSQSKLVCRLLLEKKNGRRITEIKVPHRMIDQMSAHRASCADHTSDPHSPSELVIDRVLVNAQRRAQEQIPRNRR